MNRRFPLTALPLLGLLLLPGLLGQGSTPAGVRLAQEGLESPTPTATLTQVPEEPTTAPTSTSDPPTATQTSDPPPATLPAGRPIVIVESYGVGSSAPSPGQDFTLNFRLANSGSAKARNVVASFGAGDFVPGGNGGVVSAGTLAPGASTGFSQRMFATSSLASGAIGLLSLTVSYTDDEGTGYSESFNLGIGIGAPARTVGSGSRVTPTPTPTPVPRPLLIVVGQQSEPSQLRPGSEFELTLEVHNFGGGRAERIAMVLGSGSGGGTGQGSGDGSTSGGGDFATFAPLGSSNIQFLGDLEAGKTFRPVQRMIVSGTTKAGVYTISLTFNYTDDKGKSFSDQQVISLLVQSSPLLDVSFYRPLEPLFAGQPASLPIQVVNMDRVNMQLGRMRVTYNGLLLENGETMIGYLDPGGYYTLDPMFFPEAPGPVSVLVSVSYVDDFYQLRSFDQELQLVVEAMPEFPDDFPPPDQGEVIDGGPVTVEGGFWRSLWRAILGLLGLDSGPATEPGMVEFEGQGEFQPSGEFLGPPG